MESISYIMAKVILINILHATNLLKPRNLYKKSSKTPFVISRQADVACGYRSSGLKQPGMERLMNTAEISIPCYKTKWRPLLTRAVMDWRGRDNKAIYNHYIQKSTVFPARAAN